MIQEQHPITPLPELVQKFADGPGTWLEKISKAYCAGADRELEVCCDEIINGAGRLYVDDSKLRVCLANDIRTVRRPKPPSLKEQALKAVQNIDDACESEGFSRGDDTDIIRRALESLPD